VRIFKPLDMDTNGTRLRTSIGAGVEVGGLGGGGGGGVEKGAC
jgi:hypothetical protein